MTLSGKADTAGRSRAKREGRDDARASRSARRIVVDAEFVKRAVNASSRNGGRISDIAADASAFARRKGTQYCIQYYSSWMHAADTPADLAQVAKVYAAMRPFMPGASYVNYCDLDLQDYPRAYWGANLPRLMDVKAQYDPDNLFHHAQSVPLPPPA